MDGAVLLVQPVVSSSHPDIDRSHQPHLVSVILDVAWDTNLAHYQGYQMVTRHLISYLYPILDPIHFLCVRK